MNSQISQLKIKIYHISIVLSECLLQCHKISTLARIYLNNGIQTNDQSVSTLTEDYDNMCLYFI